MLASKNLLVGVIVLTAFCGIGLSEDVNWNGLTVPVEFWTGTGSNSALCVVDFMGTGNDVRYAFGYRWDGTAYTSDMLLAIDAASTDFVLDYYNGTYGMRVESITYNGLTLVDSGSWNEGDPCIGFWWDGYTEYEDYLGDPVPGEAPDNTFAASMLGASGRELADGFADGWSQDFTNTSTWAIVSTPNFPSTAPEPASLVAMLAGAALLVRKKK